MFAGFIVENDNSVSIRHGERLEASRVLGRLRGRMRANVLRGRLRTVESVIYAVLDGEGVLLDTRTGVYFGLDAVGTRIWELLAPGATLDELVHQLLDEYDVDGQRLTTDVEVFVRTLAAKGLITEAQAERGE